MSSLPVALSIAGAAMALAVLGCSKKVPAQDATCEVIEERSQGCGDTALRVIRSGLMPAGSAAASDVVQQQARMLEVRFREKLRTHTTLRQCEKFRDAVDDSQKRRFVTMQGCQALEGCEAFARCMLELP